MTAVLSHPTRPLTAARHTLGHVLLGALHAHGVREIFGIPGDFALPLFDAIEQSRVLPLYTLSHEPAVGFAADAAARVRSAPAVAAVTYGAGALNMVNAVACAYAEKSPVIVLSGAPGHTERRAGLLLHHQAKTLDSQAEIYRQITCDQACLDDPRTAPQAIARVLASALRESRPVYIEIPRDMPNTVCDAVTPLPEMPVDGDALATCADEIIERLAHARSPVLMVGVEVRRYGLERAVADLARVLGIPVVTSLMGRGLLADADAPLAGTYLGVAGAPEITALVESSDALLLLGVILSDTNLGVSRERIDLRKTVQALDGQVTVSHHVYPHIPLKALVHALHDRAAPLADRQTFQSVTYPRNLTRDGAPVTPPDIAAAINDLMAERGVMPIACDMGDAFFTAMDIVPTAHVAPGYYATMGFGVPAALGLQAASGRRPIVLVGDGAFQMTGMELGHCVRYGWDPIVIVLNNSGWGMLSAFRPTAQYNDLGNWRLDRVADALGGRGVRVTTRGELWNALTAAHRERGRFQLIDVQIARNALSPVLRRFADAVARLH